MCCFLPNVIYFCSSRAFKDAESATVLAAQWPKGYFRKGRALTGLEVSDCSFDVIIHQTSPALFYVDVRSYI